ncbi:MAG: DNA-processing protein DprA [Neisseria sp.]|nr:DNA-processing protein DprA [Neisseria sp.]
MTSQALSDYLLLALTPYLGPISFAALLAKFGDASTALSASPAEIRPCLERANQSLPALLERSAAKAVTAALAWARQEKGCRLMTLLDDDYPMLLAEGMAPPPVLFLRGRVELLSRPMIAMVGSRHATPQARQTAERLAREVAAVGWTVVSGFADGIDAAAHRGALHETGGTVGIFGTGIDRIYPARHRDLALDMARQGLLISEFPLGTTPNAVNFPRRNRLIAALGRATVVVEAAEKSGSLITARLAGEMGRDVMAVPGSIYNPQAAGCHKLIREGAKLITSAQDILEEYPDVFRQPERQPELDLSEQKQDDAQPDELLQLLGFDAVHPDELAEKLQLHPAEVYAKLLDLELAGAIASVAGGRFQRIE